MEEHSDSIPDYKSYWLRCWKGSSQQEKGQGKWRFSLENPETGQKKGFNDLAALVDYLQSYLAGTQSDTSMPEPDIQVQSRK